VKDWRSSCTLLLAGHGSERNPNTRTPVDQAASLLRAKQIFADVQVTFWRDEPRFHEALHHVQTADVIVVPMFMSEGYYTREVLPRELAKAGAAQSQAFNLHRTAALGTDPRMAQIMMEKAAEVQTHGPASLIILGHGTPKNPDSGKTTEAQAERIRQQGPFKDVLTAFIDQEPLVEKVIATCLYDEIVMVPFFVADGWHVSETVPEDLGLEEGRGQIGNKSLYYTPAIGTDPRMVEVILDLVAELIPREGEPLARDV